jgi:cysteine-rich repeat protein
MMRLGFVGFAQRIALLAAVLLVAGAGCASQGTAGAGGSTSSTGSETATSTATSTSSASSSASGTGGAGGSGGSTATATASVTSTATASSSASGTGGAGGTGGTGGAGGMFVPPTGTAEYPAEMEQNNIKTSANPLQMGTKGFTASIWPLGDVDVFSFDVPMDGSIVTVAVSDGMGGCPPGASAFLRLIDKNGANVATDKISGPGGCPLLDPKQVLALQTMATGKYFVQVESAGIDPIPFYILDIQIKSPGCGDGFAQYDIGEQCDDGNMASGDGCSATCQLEGGFVNEAEPNDTPATANSLNGVPGIIGSINPTGDHDYFTFDVTVPGSSISLLVGDGLIGCPGAFDSKMTLFDGNQSQLAVDDDGGVPHCSAIKPSLYPSAGNLPVGKYYVMVQYIGDGSTQPFYVLTAKLTAPSCGDSIVQVGEQCDDGNTVSGDGCSATCQLEGNYITETEPNDTQATANPLGGADGFFGAILPVGDQDYFTFDVAVPGSSAYIQVTDGLNGCPPGFDSKLSLFNPAHILIGTDDNGGTNKCSLISPATTAAATNLAVGTYTTRVEFNGNNQAQGFYVLKIKVVPPACGDNVIQLGEQCDDGNAVSGDGCTSACQSEPPYEIEPNNSYQTATAPWPGFSYWLAGIKTAGDHDYFSFVLPAVGSATMTVHSAGNANACPADMYLHLLNSVGFEIDHDDDDGVFPCPSLTKVLPAGTYYVWVQRYMDSTAVPAYQFDLTIQ